MSETITAGLARALLPARPADAHKYTFGRALVVAGSLHYPGAASLATAAAARTGAGLVTLATGRSALGGPGRIPEVTLLPLPEAEPGALAEAAADDLRKELPKTQALLVGPGIGRAEPTKLFLAALLGIDAPNHRPGIGFRHALTADSAAHAERAALPPMVLDADGLTLLAELASAAAGVWERLTPARCVLTPHAGEMARLLGVETLEGDRVELAREAAARWGQIVLLKGPQTVIAAPDGRVRLHDGANPALATAGTGDVLAGAIVGLLAQGVDPFDAAALGCYLHGAAGRMVADELGDMGALASDLLPRLPLAARALRRG